MWLLTSLSQLMATIKNIPHITPLPGYLFCIPYLQENKIFKSAKESAGEDQMSEVIAVGASIVDSQGIERVPNCVVGDIIIHAASNKDGEVDFIKFRFVHFTEIHGIWKTKK